MTDYRALTPAEALALATTDPNALRLVRRHLGTLQLPTWAAWVDATLAGRGPAPWRVTDPLLLRAMAVQATGRSLARWLARTAPELYMPQVAR